MAISAKLARTTALKIFIGFSMRALKAGMRRCTHMPSTTGTSTITTTSSTLPNCSGTTWPVRAKVAMAQLVMSGRLTMDSRVLMAVSEMFIATLPPNRWLNRLADTPPGDAASSISPTA